MEIIEGLRLDVLGRELQTVARASAADARDRVKSLRKALDQHVAACEEKDPSKRRPGRDDVGGHGSMSLFGRDPSEAEALELLSTVNPAKAARPACHHVLLGERWIAQYEALARDLEFLAAHFKPEATYRISMTEYNNLAIVPEAAVVVG